MAMRKRERDVTVPNGSLIVWMAGLVLGLGAGVVLVYHLLLGSHAQERQRLRDLASAPPVVATGDMRSEHAQAMRDAMKPSKS